MSAQPKVLVVYSSIFGANAALAKKVEGALRSEGAEVRVRGIPQIVLAQYETPAAKASPKATEEDLEWADGYVFLSPVHSGTYAAAVKAFVDNHHDGALAGKFMNKTFTGMITAELLHSGQEAAANGLNDIAAVWGCLAVTPSTANRALNASNGNAFGLSFTLEKGKLPEGIDPVIQDHLSRFCRITSALIPQGAAGAPESGAAESAAESDPETGPPAPQTTSKTGRRSPQTTSETGPHSPQTFAGNVGG